MPSKDQEVFARGIVKGFNPNLPEKEEKSKDLSDAMKRRLALQTKSEDQ